MKYVCNECADCCELEITKGGMTPSKCIQDGKLVKWERVIKPWDELFEEACSQVNWDRVHKTMLFLDWGWIYTKGGSTKVPSIEELKEEARNVFNKAVEFLNAMNKSVVTTGGIQVSLEKEGDDFRSVDISFILSKGESEFDGEFE